MNKIKKYLFICLILGCFVPAIQKQHPFINSKGLSGWFPSMEIPSFSWEKWFTGNFQWDFDKSFELNIGLHSSFVRLNNQINYSLFNFATAKNVLVGKDGYLFEAPYINEYMGVNHPDSNAVKLKIAKAEYVRNELEKRGKHLLIIFAPGKASYYPEYIPYQYYPEEKHTSDYDLYSKYLANSKLNYIDFNGYFMKLKEKTPFPLYPKQGTHWSTYGATLAMDSILNYIRNNFNYNVPQLKIKEIELPDDWRYGDYDIGEGMNIMFPMKIDKLAYPKFEFENDPTVFRPSVTTIGDSYYMTLMALGLNTKAFANHEFWYYNTVIYADNVPERKLDHTKTASEIFKKDLIIVIHPEAYYNNFGMGFFEFAYEQLKNKK